MATLECTLGVLDMLLGCHQCTIETVQLFDRTPSDTITDMCEDPASSDLTIELKDGSSMAVHKTVLCSRNLYFCNLIDYDNSGTTVKTIKFPTTNVRVVRSVIRHIYGWALEQQEPVSDSDWVHWLNLIIASTGLFEPDLADAAEKRLKDHLVRLCTVGRHERATDILEEMYASIARPRVMWIIVHVVLLMKPHIVSQNDALCELILENEDLLEAVREEEAKRSF